MLNKLSKIMQRFCVSEVNKIICKYNSVSKEDSQYVENLINQIDSKKLRTSLFEDFNNTLEIAKKLDGLEDKEGIISMFLGVNNNTMMKLSISDAIEYYSDIKYNDYILLEGGRLIYKSGCNLREVGKIVLDEMLDDESHVARLIDVEVLASYWIDGVSKSKAIDELIDGVDIEELLDLYPISIFEDDNNDYMFSEIDL